MATNMRESGDRKVGEKLFWLLVLAAAFHMIYYYPLLPERVASHFDGYGRPNGWSSRDAFIAIYAFVMLLMAVLYAGIGYALPRLPDSLINLPNKDYWFAPERKAEAMAVIKQDMAVFFSATLIFLIGTMHLTIRVNVGRSETLGDWFFLLLFSYLVFVIVWSIGLIKKFSVKKTGSRER
jgi:uncharacterized membrane protein